MAATSGAIKAGRAYVEIFEDSSPLVRGLKAASGKLKAWGASLSTVGAGMMGIGAAVLGPLLAAANSFNQVGSELNDMATRTGASVEALSELAFAAKLSGVELGDVETGIRKMQKTLADAAGGSKEAAAHLSALGLSASQLKGMAPDQQLQAIADAVNKITDPTQKAAAMMAIFGKSGTALIPMLNDMKALRAEAKRLGLTMSTEDAAAADTLGDALDTLSALLKTIWIQVGAALAPTLIDLAKIMTECLSTVIKWVKENRGLIVMVAGIAAGVIVAGVAIFGLGVVLTTLGTILSAILAVLAAVKIAIAFLLSPIGLLVVALATVGTAFYKFTAAGQRVAATTASAFIYMRKMAGDSLQGIADALAAGDIEKAAKILWATLGSLWAHGVLVLNMHWVAWKGFFQNTFIDAVAFLKNAWLTFTNFFRDSFSKAVRGVVDAMGGIIDALGKLPGGLKVTGLDIGIEKMRANADALGSNEADNAKQRAQIERDRLAGRDAGARSREDELTASRDAAAAAEFARQKAVGKRGPNFPGSKGVGVPSGAVPSFNPGTKLSTTGTFGTNLRGLGTGNATLDQLRLITGFSRSTAAGVAKLKPPPTVK